MMLLEDGMMIWNWIGLVEGDLLMRLNRMHSLAMLSLILLNRIPSFDTNQPNLVYPYRNH